MDDNKREIYKYVMKHIVVCIKDEMLIRLVKNFDYNNNKKMTQKIKNYDAVQDMVLTVINFDDVGNLIFVILDDEILIDITHHIISTSESGIIGDSSGSVYDARCVIYKQLQKIYNDMLKQVETSITRNKKYKANE